MNILRLFGITVITLFVVSCDSKTYKLSDSDFDWIPYTGRDTLVFTSNNSDTDTLFLKTGKTYMDYKVDPLSLVPQDSTENFEISYKYNYFDTTQKINNFGVWPLIIMKRTKEGTTNVGFSITKNKTAYLDGMKFFKIDELKNQKLVTVETKLKKYNDVFIIVPDTLSLKYSNHNDYVLKMYWSKSEGLIRFDKNNNVHYILTKK